YDAVAICVGITQNPQIPVYEGQDTFTGKILHSANYTNPEEFRNKKVVCVGVGESGADIAHQIANVANECTLSIRHYPSILDRWYN
ncbi:SidA/IucD/PvdA family monooxygenase, partial [Vibrio cyclitrophicus]